MAKRRSEDESVADVGATQDRVADDPTVGAATGDMVEQHNREVEAIESSDPHPVDVVSVPSLYADGSVAQTEGYRVLDPERARESVSHRLREQRVSNADAAARGALAGLSEGGSEVEDPTIQALKDKHESAVGDVDGDAEKLLPNDR